MNIEDRLALSFFRETAVIDEAHRVSVVQHSQTKKIGVKKILSVYNEDVYRYLMAHPVIGIPQILCVCRDGDDLAVVEEYISGRTFEELLSEHGPFSEEETCRYGIQLCGILEQLHACSPPVIHRDIKPSNVMLTSSGALFLLDLNAAKFYHPGGTSDTVLLGTKGYAAPEQYGFGSSDIRTDIYSTGMFLNALLKGDFSPEPAAGSTLGKVIGRCLQLNTADRYPDAASLRSALQQILTPEAPADPPVYKTSKWMLPGFRTGDPTHMVLGTAGYLIMLYISSTLSVNGVAGPAIWLERVFCFLMMIGVVLFTSDYLGVQSHLPLCKSKKKAVRIFGILLYDLAFVIVLMVLMILLE